MTAPAGCPVCGGPWLWSLTWRHVGECRIRVALDATQAADAEPRARTRPATAAELELCAVLGATLTPPVAATVTSPPPIWLRRFTDAAGQTFNPTLKGTSA